MRPPKPSLDMMWSWASTKPRTRPWASVPLKGSPVTPICASGAGRADGSHQFDCAAELGTGPSTRASTANSSDTTVTEPSLRRKG